MWIGFSDFAVGRGLKSFAVLAPQSDYGDVATAEFQKEAARLNARVVTVARYATGQPAESGKKSRALRIKLMHFSSLNSRTGLGQLERLLLRAG